MTIRKRSRRFRLLSAAALTLLVACGGGSELLLAIVVTPLNGTWLLQGVAAQESIVFNAADDVQFFSNQYDLTASLEDASDSCGGAANVSSVQLAGTFDNGAIVLRAKDVPNQPVCIEGSIVNLIRFEAAATGARPARSYENSRVDVQMDLGIWVSDGAGTRIKFSDVTTVDNDSRDTPIRACDVSGTAPVVLDGLMDGFQKATQKRPYIAALTQAGQSAPRFTDVDYVDGATITLRSAAGAMLTLRRQREAVPTVCS